MLFIAFRGVSNLCDGCLNYWAMRDGTNEFNEFVTKTFHALVEKEEKIIKRTSSLRIFCRVDVSVMDDGGRFSYFVSGLERSFGTPLCASCTPVSPTFA